MKKLKLDQLGRPSLREYRNSPKLDLIVVLDNIRSGLNVGSIFRTCDAMSVKKVVLAGITPQPPHKEINKTALGATESVDWEYAGDVTTAVRQLEREGYNVWLVEQTDEATTLDEMPVAKNSGIALVFGNEVNGVSDSLLEIVNRAVEIPQYGTKHSFNVAVSAGIVLWHVTSRIRQDGF